MVDLIARRAETNDGWRQRMEIEVPLVLGRQAGSFQVDWDDRISRRHAIIKLRDDNRADVELHPEGRNPIFFRGGKRDSFVLGIGEHFVIGSTTFTLVESPQINDSSQKLPQLTQHAYPSETLRKSRFRDVSPRIDALSRLPDLISGSSNDQEMLFRVTNVMLQSTASASTVAVLRVGMTAGGARQGNSDRPDPASSGRAHQQIEVLQYNSRYDIGRQPRPSGRLVRQAVHSGESVLHVWSGSADSWEDSEDSQPQFTASENVDWAFAVPIMSDACPGWVLYATGTLGPGKSGLVETSIAAAPSDLMDDVKFAELVATMVGNIQQMRALQVRQAGLSRFFAPVVMDALAGSDAVEVLEPREADISVLFCDLRGFSRQSEQQANDLMNLLRRVSQALGIMTKTILQRGGVIGDFHGDAAMGFWGWPLPQQDACEQACRTALDILRDFRQFGASPQGPLGGFRCGIGIATGRGVAGRIGTSDQVKVTAFGPVVNLASRLEGMTKIFSTEILVDESTADYVRKQLGPTVARVRRLARVRPAGMQSPLFVHQLLPPASEPGTLADTEIAAYEKALDALLDNRWDAAFELLHAVPASDRAKDFITMFIASHRRVPPDHWDGVIPLAKE
jgi:adenylate cyclase